MSDPLRRYTEDELLLIEELNEARRVAQFHYEMHFRLTPDEAKAFILNGPEDYDWLRKPDP